MNRTEWDRDGRHHPAPPAQPPGWVDPGPLRVADSGTVEPPRRPEPSLVDDGYYVELEPARRRIYQGWELDPPRAIPPVSHAFALVGLGVCLGIIVFALVWTIGRQVDVTAPSSAPDSTVERPASERPTVGADDPSPSVLDASGPELSPAPTGEIGTALIGGWATWYQDPTRPLDGRYAAAGPLVRQAFDDWRGKTIRVTTGGRETIVRLVDFCACGPRRGVPTIIDLSPAAFEDLSPLSAGVIRVEIELVELPPTDTADQHPQDPPEHPDDARMRLEVRD